MPSIHEAMKLMFGTPGAPLSKPRFLLPFLPPW